MEPGPATGAPPAATGSVFLTGAVLAMVGDVDRAAVRRLGATTSSSFTHVTAVDLTRVTYLGVDAVTVLLRCLQQVRHHRPPTRLRVHGADRRTREQLDVLGVTPLLDLHG